MGGRTKGGFSTSTLVMTFEGFGEMFEDDFADMCAKTFPLMFMGGQATPANMNANLGTCKIHKRFSGNPPKTYTIEEGCLFGSKP